MNKNESIQNEILLPWQRRWVADKSRFKIGLWSRQTGKSFSTSCEATEDCAEQPKNTATHWVCLSAGERQALEWMQKARKWAEAIKFTVDSYDEIRGSANALMSTGGMLTSLTEAGSGTLAGNAHADTWAEIRRMDSAKIGSVINRDLAGKVLDRAFPGKPHLAYFCFATEAVPSPGEVFDDATKARNAGYLVDKAQLEEMTGYKLEKIEEVPGEPFMNKKVVVGSRSRTEEDKTSTVGLEPTTRALLTAFAADTSAAGKAVAELLKKVEEVEDVEEVKEAAASLVSRLPSLLPDDPAMAAVLAEAMAKEFGGAANLSGARPLADEKEITQADAERSLKRKPI